MNFISNIFPFVDGEILTVAILCFLMTLFGLSLGFVLLKIQGE